MPSDAWPLTSPSFSLKSYDYDLPQELIAQSPAQRREDARLLVLPSNGSIEHREFSDLLGILRPGDLLVANDTRVLPARFFPKRSGGGSAQVLLLHPSDQPGVWVAMARPGKRVRAGDRLSLGPTEGIEIVDWAPGGNRLVKFYGLDAATAMQRYGQVPLPPYIRTPPADAAQRYQTVYAEHEGSVAAPTAGLHFSNALLEKVQAAGVGWTTLTLSVGAGTFRPVKTDDIREHHMHSECYTIPLETAERIARTRAGGGRIIAVGTTSLRALEDSASRSRDGRVEEGSAWTTIFIYPPYRFRAVDALITNFHLPKSTLLMLVCAFAGTERVLLAYKEAAKLGYRFYSFGDATFVERSEGGTSS